MSCPTLKLTELQYSMVTIVVPKKGSHYNNNNNNLIYIAPACRMTSEAVGQTVSFERRHRKLEKSGSARGVLPHRSYELQLEDASMRRRTSRHVRLSREQLGLLLFHDLLLPSCLIIRADTVDNAATAVMPPTMHAHDHRTVRPSCPIHTADADAIQLSSCVASESASAV